MNNYFSEEDGGGFQRVGGPQLNLRLDWASEGGCFPNTRFSGLCLEIETPRVELELLFCKNSLGNHRT
jgi:hypothetical protein